MRAGQAVAGRPPASKPAFELCLYLANGQVLCMGLIPPDFAQSPPTSLHRTPQRSPAATPSGFVSVIRVSAPSATLLCRSFCSVLVAVCECFGLLIPTSALTLTSQSAVNRKTDRDNDHNDDQPMFNRQAADVSFPLREIPTPRGSRRP